MTIDLDQITHATTSQALAYAQDYYANYYTPGDPPISYHRYDHSEHIEVLATWGHYHLFFVQSRIKFTVLYGLVGDWTDEIAMRGWIFYRDPASGIWYTEADSTDTNLHHWQEIHRLLKKEAPNMSDILDLLTEIRDSTTNSEALLNALASVGTDLLRVEGEDGDKLFAFESIVEERLVDTNLAAGTVVLDGTPVPSSKIWKITHAVCMYIGTPPSHLRILVQGLALGITLLIAPSVTTVMWYPWDGDIYLQVDDYTRLEIVGATAGDQAYLWYSGVQMNAP